MKRTFVFVYSLMVIFTSCNSQRKMQGITLYPQLEQTDISNSVEQSVDEFFQRRMRNREFEKVAGRRCEILSSDSNFVYFGYPYSSNADRKVDTIFKTRIQLLNEQFSAYRHIEGYQVKNKIKQSLKPYFDTSVNYTVLSTKVTTKYRLEPDRISVNMEFKIVKDFFINKKSNFIIDLDKSNLEIISIKQL